MGYILVMRKNPTSLYYGAPSLAHPYCRHDLWSLLQDLESEKLDPETRTAIEAEVARRAAKRAAKKAKR